MKENKNNSKEPVDKEIRLQNCFIWCYKKNTLAIFLSFTLSIMLITALLILMHTNHQTENIQWQMRYTASDCCIKNLSKAQVEKAIKSGKISWYGVEQISYTEYVRNIQTLWISHGDDVYITMTTKLLKGRMPRKTNEVVAEKWMLLNLGIEPDCNQTFTIKDKASNANKMVKLVGILSDNPGNKEYGVKRMYAPLTKEKHARYNVYIRFKDAQSYEDNINLLRHTLKLKRKQVSKCPGRENVEELQKTSVKLSCILILIFMVVFYGVYRIALISRKKTYGTLRAIGIKRSQLIGVIIKELYQIYAVSIPTGLFGGFLISLLIIQLSGDRGQNIYLNNHKVVFNLVTPYQMIAACIFIMALIILLVGYQSGRKISRRNITELIAATERTKMSHSRFWVIGDKSKRNSTLFILGGKYIVKDIRTSLFVILTICLGVTLFAGLSYQTNIITEYREDTKDMWFLNGQYEMGIQHFDGAHSGISEDTVKKVENLNGVVDIKSEAGIPIRVLYNQKVKRNEAYYKMINQDTLKYMGYPMEGNDGLSHIYKSILYGYNKSALHNLKKYIIAGDFNESGLKEDEIILSILRTDDTKQNQRPGAYKEGTPLMQYHVGDKIRIKYRADFDTQNMQYEKFVDKKAEYIYKTYKVAAIVSFSYMYDNNITVYPLFITSEKEVKSICPDVHVQWMYIDGKRNMRAGEQEQLERQLIRVGVKNQNVSTRSMISEINKNNQIYQKQLVYIIGIAVVVFILVLINIINNLKYRMQIRTREICMFRSVGMSVRMIRRMLLFENGLLAIAGIIVAFFIAHPVLRYLYQQSDMKAFAHSFRFDYEAFALISFMVILISVMVTFALSKEWKTKKIMEQMDQVE